ncbi:hypothetical protein BGZ90_012164 [Linnemannia elongata]|nr:hypothetical protein BGZ90_012164 [Linnemannia elongata]
MADMQGYIEVFYRVRPMGDITVVGKTTEEMVHRLCTADGLLEFLNDLSILWNYIDKLEAYVPSLKVAKEPDTSRKESHACKHLSLSPEKRMKEFHDKITRQLFSKEDWIEICSNLPDGSPYSKETADNLDEFERVETLKDLQDLLNTRPLRTEFQLVHECLLNW